jgi:hypothetical protein
MADAYCWYMYQLKSDGEIIFLFVQETNQDNTHSDSFALAFWASACFVSSGNLAICSVVCYL